MTLTELTSQTFDRFLSEAAAFPFYQSLEMAELYQKRGYQVNFLGLLEGDNVMVAALTYAIPMLGGHLLALDFGPICADEAYLTAFYEGLKTYGKQTGALVVQVKPHDNYQTFDYQGRPLDDPKPELIKQLTDLGYQHGGLYTGYPTGEASWNYVKDLRGLTPDSLRDSFNKKGKTLLKKASSFGLTLRPLAREELHLFKRITAATSDRRQYNDRTLAYYEDFYDALGENAEFMVASLNCRRYLSNLQDEQKKLHQRIQQLETELQTRPNSEKKQNQLREFSSQYDTFTQRQEEAKELLAKYGEEDLVLCGSLFVYSRHEAVYLFSGSYPEFNKFYAPALLQEYVMTEAIKRGIPSYNLLGIQGIFDGSDGVLRFKQQFGGYIVRKMGTFTYYPNPMKFKLISLLKKLLRR